MARSRRNFLKSALAASSASTLTSCNTDQEINDIGRPNILLLLADDQRNDTLGCAGHPFIETPNIDWLAETGCMFENAFVTTPICAASRASIFTGQHERTHLYTFKKEPLASRFTSHSYPSILKASGYRTGFIGKFGISTQKDFIGENFDYFQKINRSPYFHKLPDGEIVHETDAAIHYAKEFISDSIKSSSPFNLSISFNAPHAAESEKVSTPFPAPAPMRGMYDNEDIPAPRFSTVDQFEKLPSFLRESLNRKRFFWRWTKGDGEFEKNMKDYLSMISGIDHAIGNLIQYLDENRLLDNTVIIYSADNGFYMGDRGFAGKWSHFDESIRVPLIIRNPLNSTALKGTRIKAMALNVDLCPTILDFAGIENASKKRSGQSLTSWVNRGADASWRKDFLCEHHMEHDDIPKWEGVRSDQFTYARYFEQKPTFEFLYDLSTDPNQLDNLAVKSTHSKLLKDARQRCDELIRNT